jgi:Pre-toxin TG
MMKSARDIKPVVLFGAVLIACFAPAVAHADNCSDLVDCYSTARAALAAFIGMSVFIGMAISFGLGLLPGIGTAVGVWEAFTGRDFVTGDELAWWERALGIVPIMGPVMRIGGPAIRVGADVLGELGSVLRNADRAGEVGEVVRDASRLGDATETARDANRAADAMRNTNRIDDATGAAHRGSGPEDWDEVDEAFARIQRGDSPPGQGALLQDLIHHNQQAEAIRELRRTDPSIRTRPGKTPQGVAVNPNPGLQSAHTTPQAALRGLPHYDPGEMITRLLPTGKGHTHTLFDQNWQREFAEISRQSGRTTTTAQELFDVVERAARKPGVFAPAEAESVVQLIHEDLFVRLNLNPDQVLRIPGFR